MIRLLIALAILSACSPDTSIVTSPLIGTGDGEYPVTLAAGNNDDVVIPFASWGAYALTANASGSTLTGIKSDAEQDGSGNYLGAGVTPGQMLILRNAHDTRPITLAHNAGSTSYYRLRCPRAVDFVLQPGRAVMVMYSDITNAWQVLASPDSLWDGPSANTVPTRSLGTEWQNTTGHAVLGMYSVRVASDVTLSSGEAGRAELVIGASSGAQTTMCGRVAGSNTGTVVLGFATQDIAEAELSCIIPPSWWAIVRTVNEVGTPTFTLTAQLEQTL